MRCRYSSFLIRSQHAAQRSPTVKFPRLSRCNDVFHVQRRFPVCPQSPQSCLKSSNELRRKFHISRCTRIVQPQCFPTLGDTPIGGINHGKMLLPLFIVVCLCNSYFGPLLVHPRVLLALEWLLVVCLVGGWLRCVPVALALVVGFRDELGTPHACVIGVPQSCLIRIIWPNALLNLHAFWLPFCNKLFKPNV